MNPHFTYFLILGGSLLAPLALSFDKKVAFYTKWKWLFPAMIVPALIYIVWDIIFTERGVWSFNETYITGWHLYNLPVEEVLFFFVVPYCCLFIYECIISYFPRIRETRNWVLFFYALGFALLVAGFFNLQRAYTGCTFIALGLCILFYLQVRKYFPAVKIAAFTLSYIVILIPFLLVNGLLTAIPVVLYNDSENLGLRLYTIPFEDIFYGMLLIFLNVLIYEKLREKEIRVA